MGDFETPAGRRRAAWLAGLLYLGVIAGGIFAEAIVREGVIVPSDAAATAQAIMDNELRYRAGFGVSLVFLAFNLPILLFFFQILRPVGRSAALLMAFFFLVATSVETANIVNHYSALGFLIESRHIAALDADTAAALAYMSLDEFTTGFGVSLIYFGVYFVILGGLFRRSRLLPLWIGALLMLAGACYIINSFALFMAPSLASLLFPYILLPCLIAELCTALWLVFKGIDETRWSQLAS